MLILACATVECVAEPQSTRTLAAAHVVALTPRATTSAGTVQHTATAAQHATVTQCQAPHQVHQPHPRHLLRQAPRQSGSRL